MRLAWVLAALLAVPGGVAAQEKKKAAPKKAAVKTHAAHSKASPEQIRRFNELQKKQEREQKPKP